MVGFPTRPGSSQQAKLGSCLGRNVDRKRKMVFHHFSLLAFLKVKFEMKY